MTYWLFQGNPKYYRIIEGIRDFEQMPWLVTRYAKDMVAGDGIRTVRFNASECYNHPLEVVTEFLNLF